MDCDEQVLLEPIITVFRERGLQSGSTQYEETVTTFLALSAEDETVGYLATMCIRRMTTREEKPNVEAIDVKPRPV